MLRANFDIDEKSGTSSYLCPIIPDSWILGGHYGAENFKYIEVKYYGCNLGAEKCASNDEVNNSGVNYFGLTVLPVLG